MCNSSAPTWKGHTASSPATILRSFRQSVARFERDFAYERTSTVYFQMRAVPVLVSAAYDFENGNTMLAGRSTSSRKRDAFSRKRTHLSVSTVLGFARGAPACTAAHVRESAPAHGRLGKSLAIQEQDDFEQDITFVNGTFTRYPEGT